MDWAQANADWAKAITVAVPSICTAVVALVISRWARSHEFEKERRRRKMDCLERAIEDFDECESMIDEACTWGLTAAKFKRPDSDVQMKIASMENANQAMDNANAAQIKFARSRSKLSVLGFEECSNALDNYARAVAHVVADLLSAITAEKEGGETLTKRNEDRFNAASAFRSAIEKAFRRL